MAYEGWNSNSNPMPFIFMLKDLDDFFSIFVVLTVFKEDITLSVVIFSLELFSRNSKIARKQIFRFRQIIIISYQFISFLALSPVYLFV